MDINELYLRYKKNYKPLPKDIRTIEELIQNKFKGFEIPLTSWSANEYKYDDDIDEKHLYKLFHVNDKEVVAEYINQEEEETEEEKAMFFEEYTEEEWDELHRKRYIDDMKNQFNYDTLIIVHNEYQGFSILLESKDNIEISAFKVLGLSRKAFEILACHIGITGMIEDDLSDSYFRRYLKCLHDYNLI